MVFFSQLGTHFRELLFKTYVLSKENVRKHVIKLKIEPMDPFPDSKTFSLSVEETVV